MKIMKKQSIYALMSAIALAGAVGLSACSSSNDDVINNPDYNPETNTVKVQIAVSLQDNIAKTRMSSDATQSTGRLAQFKGMTNIKLIPFNATSITSTTSILDGSIIGLSDVPSANSGEANEANKVYSNVTVPMNTNRFLLYGEAGQAAATLAQGFDNGALTVAGLGTTASNVSGVSFSPVPICASPTQDTGYRKCKNILQLLNRIAATSVTSGTTTTTWAPGANQTTVPALVSLFNSFTQVTVGASPYIKEVLEGLYNGVDEIASNVSAPGNALAVKIQENITAALSYDDGGTINCGANTVTGETLAAKTLTLSDDYLGYPANLNLPVGAARIAYSAGSFSDATAQTIGSLSATALNHYVYPANLQYFVESDILTKNSKVLNESMPTFTGAQALYTGDGAGTSVSAETRSILLNKQIQYGVGRMDVTVNKMDGTKYFDHLGNEVTIPEAGYTLTGVLVGDQKQVGWNFAQIAGDAYTIYDNKIAGGTTTVAVTKTAGTDTNYTLVLQTTDDSPVNVALEFVNNGDPFIGQDGLIPHGATFYLLATLTPNEGGANYGTDAGKTKKVFEQDFVTTVNFSIRTGANSSDANIWGGQSQGLGEAHIGLPDLTMPKMELGLSVDLNWTPGLQFNINF